MLETVTTGKTTLLGRIAIAVRAKGYSLSTERIDGLGVMASDLPPSWWEARRIC